MIFSNYEDTESSIWKNIRDHSIWDGMYYLVVIRVNSLKNTKIDSRIQSIVLLSVNFRIIAKSTQKSIANSLKCSWYLMYSQMKRVRQILWRLIYELNALIALFILSNYWNLFFRVLKTKTKLFKDRFPLTDIKRSAIRSKSSKEIVDIARYWYIYMYIYHIWLVECGYQY